MGHGTTSLSAVKASFTAVTVGDSSAGNGVNFNDSGANTHSSSFTITLDSAMPGTSTFTGTTAFTGANALALQSGVVLGDSGAVVSTVDGNLTLLGTMQTPGKTEPTTNGVDFRALFVRRKDHAVAGLTSFLHLKNSATNRSLAPS